LRIGRLLVARELRQLVRDPLAWSTIVLAPILLAAVASISLGAHRDYKLSIGIALEGTRLTQEVIETRLAGTDPSDAGLRAVDAADARALVQRGELAAAVIIPDDPDEPVVVVGALDTKMATQIATSIARTTDVLRQEGIPSDPVVLSGVSPGREPLNGAEVYGPVVAVFFVLFGVGFVGRSIQGEREEGTLPRLLASPVLPRHIIYAKCSLMFVVGMVEFMAVYVSTVLVFGADWGNPFGVVLVAVAWVLCALAIALAIAAAAKSPARAQAIELVVALGLVVLGGHMVPLRSLPDVAGRIAHVMPNGVAIDTLSDVASGTVGLTAVLAPLVYIVGFAVIVGVFSGTRVRKALVA
jgi:ABC-2 type transport system permease protein